MADLYDRLDEIQGMTRVLTNDVARLSPLLGDTSMAATLTDEEEGNRRFYVRAIFALIEAVVEQHKRLLLDLDEHGSITLSPGVRAVLSELTYAVRDNGAVADRGQYLELQRKLRAVYRAAGESLGQTLAVSFDDGGWASFQAAVEVRNRITHPRIFQDCDVDAKALNAVDQGHAWFRNLNNEFVRVARAHRSQHHW